MWLGLTEVLLRESAVNCLDLLSLRSTLHPEEPVFLCKVVLSGGAIVPRGDFRFVLEQIEAY